MSKNVSTPDFLFHYTNINTLALILKHRRIKFSSITTVNDLTEGRTFDVGNLGQFVFVSCWTDMEEESLPFWNMYTYNMAGIRIKLPSYIFNKYNIPKTEIYDSLISPIEMVGDQYLILPPFKPLIKVKYTEDKNLLNPRVLKNIDRKKGLALGILGQYKRTHWAFENEWRFLIQIIPTNSFKRDNLNQVIGGVDLDLLKTTKLSFSSYYIKMSDESFTNMEILLGPKHNKGDREIVNALIQTYNPKARLKISTLFNEIR